MKRVASIAAVLALAALALTRAPARAALPTGSRIKGTTFSAVYYYGANGKRYVFPNEKTYKTWYSDFSGVITIPDSDLAQLPIGGNVTYKPGARMVKIQSIPNVYAVAAGGVLRWVKTEAVASSLYGSVWNQKIDDVPDAYFVNYASGEDIDQTSDYDPAAESAAATSINIDKGLVSATPPPPPPPPQTGTIYEATILFTAFNPNYHSITLGDTICWTNVDVVDHSVTSDPHTVHTDLPGLTVNPTPPGGRFCYTFDKAGTWGYHDHVFDFRHRGTVVVSP